MVYGIFARGLQTDEPHRPQRYQEYKCQRQQRYPPGEGSVEGHELVYLHNACIHQRQGRNQTDEQRTEREAYQQQLLAARTGAEDLADGNVALALGDEIDAHGRQSEQRDEQGRAGEYQQGVVQPHDVVVLLLHVLVIPGGLERKSVQDIGVQRVQLPAVLFGLRLFHFYQDSPRIDILARAYLHLQWVLLIQHGTNLEVLELSRNTDLRSVAVGIIVASLSDGLQLTHGALADKHAFPVRQTAVFGNADMEHLDKGRIDYQCLETHLLYRISYIEVSGIVIPAVIGSAHTETHPFYKRQFQGFSPEQIQPGFFCQRRINHNLSVLVAQGLVQYPVQLYAQIERAAQHGYGQTVLEDIEQTQIQGLGLSPESALHHIHGIVVRKQGSREESRQERKQQDGHDVNRQGQSRKASDNIQPDTQQLHGVRFRRLGKQKSQHKGKGREQNRLQNHPPENIPACRAQQAPRSHFLGTVAGLGHAHAHIIEHGHQQNQDAHRQENHYLLEAVLVQLHYGIGLREIEIMNRDEMRLFQTAVPVRPENGFQISRHIRSLVIQVCMLYRTHKQDTASGISHIRVIHICRVIDVLHVFERHEHVPFRREDRVVDVVHHPTHPIILLVEGTPQHFSQAVRRAEQLQGKRTAQHHIVIATHHLPAVPADQRQREEAEKVLPDHRYVSVHLPVVCFYHKPLI